MANKDTRGQWEALFEKTRKPIKLDKKDLKILTIIIDDPRASLNLIQKEVGLAMGGWFLSIAMAQYVAGIIAAIASGGTGGGHGIEQTAATITQYSDVYMLLFQIGLGVGILYLVLAPLINKLMHGVK